MKEGAQTSLTPPSSWLSLLLFLPIPNSPGVGAGTLASSASHTTLLSASPSQGALSGAGSIAPPRGSLAEWLRAALQPRIRALADACARAPLDMPPTRPRAALATLLWWRDRVSWLATSAQRLREAGMGDDAARTLQAASPETMALLWQWMLRFELAEHARIGGGTGGTAAPGGGSVRVGAASTGAVATGDDAGGPEEGPLDGASVDFDPLGDDGSTNNGVSGRAMPGGGGGAGTAATLPSLLGATGGGGGFGGSDVVLRAGRAEVTYGYEYTGDGPTAVITADTERMCPCTTNSHHLHGQFLSPPISPFHACHVSVPTGSTPAKRTPPPSRADLHFYN